MKTLCCWLWILTGMLFVVNIIIEVAYFEDIFASPVGWGGFVGLWSAQFAGVMFMLTLGLCCMQTNHKTSKHALPK